MVLGFLVVTALLCLSLVLFSLKFYILGEDIYQNTILDAATKKYENPDFLHFKDAIAGYNANLVTIHNFYNSQTYMGEAIKDVLAVGRPGNLYFTNIAFERSGDKVKVAIAGVSDTRDNLLVFRDNLKNDTAMENVNVPPESWVKAVNPHFYITFQLRAGKGK